MIAAIEPTPAALLQAVLLLTATGVVFVLAALLVGALVRRRVAHRVKSDAYECGELPVGQGAIQFDLRFYVVALVFVIFDIEVALFFPWAVIYRDAGLAGLLDMLFFFGVIVVGFAFLWRLGYLEWVRSTTGQGER